MINLFVITSSLENLDKLKSRTSDLVDKIISNNSAVFFSGYHNNPESIKVVLSKVENSNAVIILNTSGGTEDLILTIAEISKSQIFLIADPNRNSFASSLEAYAYLKENYHVKIVYCNNEEEKLKSSQKIITAVRTKSQINKSKFGLIGEPSDWLLTSRDFRSFGIFKTEIQKIKVAELVNLIDSTKEESVHKIVDEWESTFKEILVDNKSLIDSAKVYSALKNLISKYELNALSIRCFDLLDYNYTACMALSMLNDEGIVSGCEGDLPTTFTMMLASFIKDDVVWMANPSSINKEKNEIIFAHCTVPSKFLAKVEESGLTTHMESNKSTAIRGPLKNSEVSILRFGKDFNKLSLAKGNLVKSDMKSVNLCRTQAVIKLDGSVENWVSSALGNHHVIVYGNVADEIKYFCELTSIELIQI